MILFLNFAPIHFMGGAEKWMLDMAEYVSKFEKTKIIDVASEISDIYGKLILKRPFNNNLDKHRPYHFDDITSLKTTHFIPFTGPWKSIRKIFLDSEIIYLRSELAELLICLYFGGPGIFKKTIAGLHMSIAYENPLGLAQQLHNILYTSFIFKWLLSQMRLVHVINKRDEKLLLEKFNLQNVVYLPNGTVVKKQNNIKSSSRNNLRIIFVGELSTRKGVDTIAEIVKKSPKHFSYIIVGNGPLREDVEQLSKNYSNCKYYGYVTNPELIKLYQSSDVILFPSRAEAFGLVMIEAMAQGLLVVNSSEVALGLPSSIEHTATNREPETFLKLLTSIYNKKKKKVIDKQKIIDYCYNYFSIDEIYPQFLNKLLLKAK